MSVITATKHVEVRCDQKEWLSQPFLIWPWQSYYSSDLFVVWGITSDSICMIIVLIINWDFSCMCCRTRQNGTLLLQGVGPTQQSYVAWSLELYTSFKFGLGLWLDLDALVAKCTSKPWLKVGMIIKFAHLFSVGISRRKSSHGSSQCLKKFLTSLGLSLDL